MELLFENELNILIVDDNNAPFILPLIRSFSGHSNINLDVVVFSEEKPHLFRYSKYIRKVYHIKSRIQDCFEEEIRNILTQSPAQFMIPTREWISQLVSKHNHWLSKMVTVHPVSDWEILEQVTDKWKLNQWLKVNQFPFSRALLIAEGLSGNPDLIDIPYPFLIKPRTGAGGIGIKLIKDPEEFQRVSRLLEKPRQDYILQEYIEGFDIDVSVFARDGKILCHTIQRGISNGSFTFPRGIEFVRHPELLSLVNQIIRKVQYSGVAHLDFRYDATRKTFILVDFNARYWNSLQGSRIMGVNFPLLAAAYSLDIPVTFPDYKTGFYYYGTAAITQVIKNLTTGNRKPVRFKNSQLHSIAMDPLPELLYMLSLPFKAVF